MPTFQGLEHLEPRMLMSASVPTFAWAGTNDYTNAFDEVVVAEGRIGDRSGTATFELGLGANTSNPATTAQWNWGDGVVYDFSVNYTPAAAPGTGGTVTFQQSEFGQTSGPTLSYTVSEWEASDADTIFIRTAAYTAGSRMTVDDLFLTASALGPDPIRLQEPDGSGVASVDALGSGLTRDTIQVAGVDLQAGFTLTGRSEMSWNNNQPVPKNSKIAFQIKVGDYTAAANLTAYRPQDLGGGYQTFGKTAVAESDEFDGQKGVGIRLNGLGDDDSGAENDLVEVEIGEIATASGKIRLKTDHAAVKLFNHPDGDAASAIQMVDGTTAAFTPTGSLWVAWDGIAHGNAVIEVIDDATGITLDTIRLHTFESIVVGLGGALQDTATTAGTGQSAQELYEEGYDTWWFSHSDWKDARDEILAGLDGRGINNVAIWGYSLGGNRLEDTADAIVNEGHGDHIRYTAYIDAIDFAAVFPVAERQKPPGSVVHDSFYQRNDPALRGNSTTEQLEMLEPTTYIGLQAFEEAEAIGLLTPVSNINVSGDVDANAHPLGPHVDIDFTGAVRNAYIDRTRSVVATR